MSASSSQAEVRINGAFLLVLPVMSQPFEIQWSLCVPPGLTFTISTFCPRSVFMCFVWISEQTAIISLYSIN